MLEQASSRVREDESKKEKSEAEIDKQFTDEEAGTTARGRRIARLTMKPHKLSHYHQYNHSKHHSHNFCTLQTDRKKYFGVLNVLKIFNNKMVHSHI